MHLVADVTRAREGLKWEARTSLRVCNLGTGAGEFSGCEGEEAGEVCLKQER